MKLSGIKYFLVLLIAPYLIGMSPADTSYTEYSFGAGSGQYATHDCSGLSNTNSMVDVGLKAIHKFDGPFRTGASISVYSINGKIHSFAYPDLALDTKYFSIGTTGIRVGSEDTLYGEISFLDQVPYFTGKGCLRIGVGIKVLDNTRLWLGTNSIPYDQKGFAGQFEFPISSTQFVYINGRYGLSGNILEYGVSIGTRLRLR